MCHKLTYVVGAAVLVSLSMTGVAGAADPSLVGWWKLDDGSGTVAQDSSANENHGTLNGNALWIEGVLGGALQLDGSTAYVEIPENINQAVINKGDFSMMAWIKSTDVATQNYAFQQGDLNGPGRSWLFTLNGSIQTYAGGSNFNSGFMVAQDEWYHAGFTVIEAGGADTIQMYINGNPEGDPGTRGMETCEGGYFIGTHKGMATGSRWPGDVDDVRLYNRALTADQIKGVMLGSPELASAPVPSNLATDVIRDSVLTWTPGEFAGAHDVYLSTSFDDVNDATRAADLGVLLAMEQDANAIDPGRLDFGTVYYWRVDEVNATPDKTLFRGDVWSFTAEPYSIPIPGSSIAVTASSASNEFSLPERTIDGSGLDANDMHGINPETIWFTGTVDLDPWIQYEFDSVTKLDVMKVWNANSSAEPAIGWGVKDVEIAYSVDGETWNVLADASQFSRAPGLPTYDQYDEIDFGGAAAKIVRLNIQSNWGGILMAYGLSEVQFSMIPAQARSPEPASGTVDVLLDTDLTWRAGREAAQHTVYVSTDANAVADGTAPAVTSDTPGVALASLDLALGATYYWRVDEVNEAEATSVWAGPVWNFSSVPYVTVEDFEQYGNLSPDRPFQTWLDGFGYSADEFFPEGYGGNGTGAGIGHDIWSLNSPHYNGDIMETGDTFSGNGQSMPLYYTNSGGVASQTERTFAAPQEWTIGSPKTLSLAFKGQVGNTGTLFITINNAKVTYQRDNGNIGRGTWQVWNIDLSSVNTNLSSITKLTLGVEGAGASGMILFDDIRLFPNAGELITPTDPGTNGLAGAWSFDEGSGTTVMDSSGNGRNGTIVDATWEAGRQGSALLFNGTSAYVNIDGYKGINAVDSVQQAFTIANWVKTTSDTGDTEMVTWGASTGTATRLTWRVHEGRVRTEHNAGNLRGNTYVNDGEWHHVALVVTEGANLRPENTRLYVDGAEDSTFSGDDDTYQLVAEHDVRIGMSGPQDGRYFPGSLDEVMIYDRALSTAEILWLAGRTEPIDKPF